MKKTFVAGLFVLIPLIVTLYIIYVVVASVDIVISPAMKNLSARITGREFYIPGTGLVIFVLIVYLAGVLASNYLGKKLISFGEKILRKIPIVKSIYSSVKDMTEAFSSEKKKAFQETVLTDFPVHGHFVLGFVVNRTHVRGKPFCSVFVPTTPNPTSGYLIMVPEPELIFVDMPVDDALKYIVSIGTTRVCEEWRERKSI